MRVSMESVANLAIVCACVFVVGAELPGLRKNWSAPAGPATRPEVGDRLDWLRDIDFSTARQGTLVLFVNSTCTYCTESMPFFGRLSSLPTRASGALRLVAVSTESLDRLRAYLLGYAVSVDQLVSVPPAENKVRSTPTLLLVGRDGRIERVWRGLLGAAEQARIFRDLSLDQEP